MLLAVQGDLAPLHTEAWSLAASMVSATSASDVDHTGFCMMVAAQSDLATVHTEAGIFLQA